MQIYLDYSATTPPRTEAIAKMQEILSKQWGNPSSLHDWGQRSAMVLEEARMQVARLINAPSPDEIVFTSGGTEANNLAIMGVVQQYSTPQHLIISSVEHSAISEPVQRLEQRGWQVTCLPVNRYGRANPTDLANALQPNTVLISIIYGQSEVGTLQPIAELAQIARQQGILFHTDAVQVAGRLPLDVGELGVDLLSLSSHKLYGPQGAGALYCRRGVELVPLFGGGGQEGKLRSGTQAVPIIAGFGVAAELAASEMAIQTARSREMRDRLFDLLADSPYLTPTGDRLYRLPHHVSFCLGESWANATQVTGKTLVRQLNLAGIGISAGSACHSGKLSPSPILTAMGYPKISALAGIRLTLGRHTTVEDIDWTAMVLQQILKRLMPEAVAAR
ncbi:cysteine desulfurase [Lusitaniella coriacea LEGE 07157]|uniref:cysteine desulfurase n=1 Tax=Lusitaniella coriacea LEGE 07157 TaxID=945747 RepID=A0A8J7DW52_9CYAN|nr:cysteine desulfurase family protein [Lusitaniella coriacea]MBE9116221.1 cysteine desulfurase [Lusitaniella coriacea LEGE 07157]